jgi:LuxR family maltose regulon positive regulatory protein
LPTGRALTVLKAASGFGKTTLMAKCCRRLRRDGVATTWVSLDENDEPDVLDVYIAFACASAGLNLLNISLAEATAAGPGSRIGAVVRAIESFGRPFVIAFDELERLKQPGSVELLAFLMQRRPSNLHLAFTCRELPDGLDLAGPLLSGHAVTIETEELRFSRAEVARFFGLRLSRRALAKEVERSAGWPVAMRVSRNAMECGTAEDGESAHALVGNWIEARLFADLERDDRNFVLDLAQLDWLDAALLDDILQRSDSMRRLQSMTALTGLLESLGDRETRRWRLHPLAREHCADRRFREDPERFAAIHRRSAKALARRGETVMAMRHAREGNDAFLAGRILEEAGGLRLWTRQGLSQFRYASELLTDEVVTQRPRLKLVRCAALALAGRAYEARALYRECTPAGLRGGDAADFDLFVDDCWARLVLSVYGASPVCSDRSEHLVRDLERLVTSEALDPAARGVFEYGLCILHFLRADFDPALDRLTAALESDATRYVAMYGELLHGQIEFVRGRLQEARSRFRRARRIARKFFLADPVATTSCDVVMQEAALECDRASPPVGRLAVPTVLMSNGVPYSLFATASNLLIGARLRQGHLDDALAIADRVLVRLRRAGLTAFVRLVVALRISVLLHAGRLTDAERAWRREELPEAPVDCVDLTAQTWREMEAVSEARTRLLIAGRRFDDARSLLRQWRAVSIQRGLRRTEMAALALSVVLEQRAGETQASQRHLAEYLRLFADSPIAWPLVRDRKTCADMLRMYVDSNGNAPHHEAARSLLSMCGEDERSDPAFNQRELEVLRLLAGRQDKEIAVELGLSAHGVRYHLRSIFAKLGAGNRTEAIRRTREMGLIQDDS